MKRKYIINKEKLGCLKKTEKTKVQFGRRVLPKYVVLSWYSCTKYFALQNTVLKGKQKKITL